MKIIITEEQYKRINEITIFQGVSSVRPTHLDVLHIIREKISESTYNKAIKEYLKNVLGYPEKFTNKFISHYAEEVPYIRDDSDRYTEMPKQLKNPEVLSNLVYFLSKKFLKIRMLGNLECYIDDSGYDKAFYFFDPELETCVGYISCKPIFDYYNGIDLPDNSYAVNSSQVDAELKGRGYGKEMYLSVLDYVSVLLSDTALYGDSLNIWVNVLPKYVYVGALYKKSGKSPKIMSPETKILNHQNVERYFATKKPKLITQTK